MARVATQLHGYRHGHQLLDGSINLPKADQSLIDRLSDLAGPLRPGEEFAPYVSGFPLPSGKYYVLARTWQDLTVARAGCVRTLSLIIPTEQWKRAESVRPYFAALRLDHMPDVARPLEIAPDSAFLEPVTDFGGDELLEALFLEDPKPVAVFDASAPELIAVRLLSALWSGLREQFSVSTFALSPRKLDTKFFDLVFAPKDVRSRFSNWSGRRIDARSSHTARHRWTGSIVDRVFRSPHPKLLEDRELESLKDDERSTPSVLRISLLWDELLLKVRKSPSAALGLLDVASSKFDGGSSDMIEIRPLLASAAIRAGAEMPPSDGWAFLTAMLRKIQGTPFETVAPAIAEASSVLAKRSATEAIALLEQPDPLGIYRGLVSSIAIGLSEGFATGAEKALADALPETLVGVLVSDDRLAQLAVGSKSLLRRLSEILPAARGEMFIALRDHLLPLLSTSDHEELATPFIGSLGQAELLAEVDLLAGNSKASLPTFVPLIVARAKELNAEFALRRKAISLGSIPLAQRLVQASLVPCERDARWIVEEGPPDQAPELLAAMIRQASRQQLNDIFYDYALAKDFIAALLDQKPDLLTRIARETWLPLDLYLPVVERVGLSISGEEANSLSRQALQRCFREHFSGDEAAVLQKLIYAAGDTIDATWLIHNGLAGQLNASVVSRNLVVFARLDRNLKKHIAKSIEAVADVLSGRWRIDLDASAAFALSDLLGISQREDRKATLRASGRLLPALMRSTNYPVSSVVSATFPHVYRELAQEEEVPDILKFVAFFDWDRCKAARGELVTAFMQARPWRPSDFALTAWKCSDTERFMRRLAKSYRGDAYLDRIEADTSDLPNECAEEVRVTISTIRRQRDR